LGKQVKIPDGSIATVLGLDNPPFGRKKPNVVLLDQGGALRIAKVPGFIELMRQHDKQLLKAA
jgi:hypothetical protein